MPERSEKKSGGIYLARTVLGRPRFTVRQTYPDAGGVLRHRELFDLGRDPGQFLLYPLGNYLAIRDDLLKAVAAQVEGDATRLLEELLLPFIREDLREKLETALARQQSLASRAVTPAERGAIAREVHLFDRRRLHYLWYGSIDQSRLFRLPDKLCRRLLGKSRDEKEQYFIALEQVLPAGQVKEYLFTVFDLQRRFAESAARLDPQKLDAAQLDAFFLDELCRLNADARFWLGLDSWNGLQPYLVRYLIQFFDYDFGESAILTDYIKEFMDRHRQFRFPERKRVLDLEEASVIFGEPAERLAKLSKKELKNLFRNRALKLHPDTGGNSKQFVRLKEAFEALLRSTTG